MAGYRRYGRRPWGAKTKAEQPDLPPEKLREKALASAMALFARRDHSERELRQKLEHNYPPQTVEEVVEEARRRRWLRPPEELAESVARTLSRKGRSHRYINGYLKQRGLPPVLRDQDQEREKCLALLETRFRKAANFTFEEKQKALRWLRYRGFDDDLIRRVLYEKS